MTPKYEQLVQPRSPSSRQPAHARTVKPLHLSQYHHQPQIPNLKRGQTESEPR